MKTFSSFLPTSLVKQQFQHMALGQASFGLMCIFLSLACSEPEPPVIIPTGGMEMAGMEAGTGMVAACVSDSSCAPGTICNMMTGACVPGQCSTSTPCPVNQMCDMNTFMCTTNAPSGCTSDANCPTGFCVAGMCRDVECVRDDNCMAGMRCDGMRCVMNTSCIDNDGDGYGQNCPAGPDCDDRNRNVNAGAPENGTTNCDDGIDNNCDGVDSICGSELDLDNDGYADKDGDCDDMNPNVNPGRMEVYYNDLDDDCNPQTNDDDQDGDGFAAESSMGPDCNDMNPNINPRAEDIPGNNIDENCDGMDRVITNDDRDGDGVSEVAGDCDDDNPDVNPNRMEIPYNSLDDDCNSQTRDNDLDFDGFGTPLDCDDNNPDVNPNTPEEYYNNIDDDCNPQTNDGDADGDGFIAQAVGGDDCNDDVASANPNGTEVPYNGIDDDCNMNTPDNDLDRDGFTRDQDCNDEDGNVNPDATENASTNCSDGIDHNCVGGDVVCDDGAVDSDGDGIPDDQDCEPNNINVPGPVEIADNGIDDDCDGIVDNACLDDLYDDANPNSAPVDASVMGDNNRFRTSLVLCPNDVDWYQVDLEPGDGLEVDIFFTDEDGDIDVRLFRRNNGALTEAGLTTVDSSTSTTDNEVVYTSRANSRDTYYIKVYQFGSNPERLDYEMSINVFENCQDDEVSPTGEHNDTLDEAVSMPGFGAYRQICDFDYDFYTFSLSRSQNLRVDVMFTDANGDIDVELLNADTNTRLESALSVTDNEEIILDNASPGNYAVRVYGVGGATNRYRVFYSSGTLETADIDDNADYDIPDGGSMPGVYTSEPVSFPEVPQGSVVKALKIQQLDINHRCVGDLKVTLLWDGQPIKTIWNRNGNNCTDGGLDDSGFSIGCFADTIFTRDICFENREYSEFAGLDAQGELSVQVTDFVSGNSGQVVNMQFDLEYYIP